MRWKLVNHCHRFVHTRLKVVYPRFGQSQPLGVEEDRISLELLDFNQGDNFSLSLRLSQ